jgi:hypothetical protein
MKLILTCILFTCSLITQAQVSLTPRIENDSLYTSSGMVVGKGQKIKLGLGTMPDGNFKFIRINSSSIFNNSEVGNYNSGYNANNVNSMNRRESGKEFTVVKIEKRGNEEHGYTYYVVVAGTPRYEVDIENAIASGELVAPYRIKAGQTTQFSVADELIKLKKILDEGLLTNEEFVVQKKKLLNQN